MSCILTQGLTLDCGDGFGGVKECYVAEFDNITAMTLTAGVITAITKAVGKKFFKYKLVAHTGEADSELTASREMGSNTVKQSVKFPINKMTTAVRNELMLLAANRLLWVIVDNNGKGWLYGKDFGLTTDKIASKTGKDLKDRNGYELAFGGDEKYLEYEIDAATLLTLETPGP